VRPRVQVLNFTATDSADAYLAGGLADDVRAALLGSRAIVLVGPHARGAADYVVSADVRRSQSGVVVAARLERPSSASVLWTQQLRRPARDIPGIAGEVAAQSLGAMGLRSAPLAARTSADPEVYDLYLRGRHLLGRRTEAALARAVAYFRQVIARDSTSPLGWAGLARTIERASRWRFRVSGLPPDSAVALELGAAERAVELAPHDPDVLVMRAMVAQDVDPTNRMGSIRAFRAAIAIDSTNIEAWKGLAFCYLETSDLPSARLALQRAAALDPETGETIATVATGWFLMREIDSAAAWAERAVAADPTLLAARGIAGQAALWRGRLDEAEAHFTAADRLGQGPSDRTGQYELTRVFIAHGDTARARAYVAAAAATADTVDPSVHTAPALADAYFAIGDTARAFWWLDRYHPRRDLHFLLHLRAEPAFDGIRQDPRFVALLGGEGR
jgi:tetratricopeptide (TPR) repeat protein